jgi:hypothetical protein
MMRSHLLSSFAPFHAPEGSAGGGPAEPAVVAEVVAAAPVAEAAAPVAEAAPVVPAVAEAPAAKEPAGEVAKPEAKAADAAAPAKEFPPSILDEAVKPTAEAKEPAKDAPAPDKPAADAKPPAKEEPAAKEAKPGEAKAPDAKPAEPPAPIEYAFKYPDTIKPTDLDAEKLGAFTGILQETRTPPEAAQKFMDMHLAEMQRVAAETERRVSERQWEVFAEQQRESRERVMADPELGGSRHDTMLKTVMSVIDSYGLRKDPNGKTRTADSIAAERKELLDDFRATGIANRPSLLRLMNWAGDTFIREGKPRPAPAPRSPAADPATRGLRRYSSTTPANNAG